LRHCATSRKVAGSIFDGVIGIFHSHNPSVRTIALGLTQPLTEVSKISPITGPRCPEGSRKLRFADYVTMAQDGGKMVSLTHRPFFTPRKYSWYSFLLESESTTRP